MPIYEKPYLRFKVGLDNNVYLVFRDEDTATEYLDTHPTLIHYGLACFDGYFNAIQITR